jgi:uncharacterized membrane-anchored protein YjiN (DUF445 family)
MAQAEGDQIIILTKWACKWLKFGWDVVVNGTTKEQLASAILKHMDATLGEPGSYVEDILEERTRSVVCRMKLAENYAKTASQGSSANGEKIVNTVEMKSDRDVVKQVISRKVTQKLIKRQRSNFAAAVSKKAYNKFGDRQMTQANVMVTRKWLQKYLEDSFKDLRTCDKNLAIDRATFLSFVPTKDFLKMRILMETNAAKERIAGTTLFGKIFRLAGGSDPAVGCTDLVALGGSGASGPIVA